MIYLMKDIDYSLDYDDIYSDVFKSYCQKHSNVMEYDEAYVYFTEDTYHKLDHYELAVLDAMYSAVNYNTDFKGIVKVELSDFSRSNYIEILNMLHRLASDTYDVFIIDHTQNKCDLSYIYEIDTNTLRL